MSKCIFLTGLPGSGKTTIAQALHKIIEGSKVLDGDELRAQSFKPLGFSRHDRHKSVCTAAYLARTLCNQGTVAICALIAPYAASRQAAERIIGPSRFNLVYLDTPAEVCEERDPKGMWAKARAGKINQFTGVDDVYEVPEDAVNISTILLTPEMCARFILDAIGLQDRFSDNSTTTPCFD